MRKHFPKPCHGSIQGMQFTVFFAQGDKALDVFAMNSDAFGYPIVIRSYGTRVDYFCGRNRNHHKIEASR